MDQEDKDLKEVAKRYGVPDVIYSSEGSTYRLTQADYEKWFNTLTEGEKFTYCYMYWLSNLQNKPLICPP